MPISAVAQLFLFNFVAIGFRFEVGQCFFGSWSVPFTFCFPVSKSSQWRLAFGREYNGQHLRFFPVAKKFRKVRCRVSCLESEGQLENKAFRRVRKVPLLSIVEVRCANRIRYATNAASFSRLTAPAAGKGAACVGETVRGVRWFVRDGNDNIAGFGLC